jgi:hypothetical protein
VHCALWAKSGQAQLSTGRLMGWQPAAKIDQARELAAQAAPAAVAVDSGRSRQRS